MVLTQNNLSAQACQPEIRTKRVLLMSGPERYRSFGEAHLPLFPFPSQTLRGTSDGAPWIFGDETLLRAA
jgi:hypothetical protein